MTPQEIFEHRQRWMRTGNNHPVRIHSDVRKEAKEFCKVQMHPSQWTCKEYTAVYEDTFYFEYFQDELAFRNHFKEWLTSV
jgi:hypothetical protein